MVLRGISALGVTAALVVGAATPLVTTPASATAPATVTMIGSGVRATHQEFDYVGASSTIDQVVAWWDFSTDAWNHRPAVGQAWDTIFSDPYDPHGHGTAAASAAVGLNAAPPSSKTPSFAPGAKLAVAKITDAAGATTTDDLAAAIAWARTTVRTDVISLGFGGQGPVPALLSEDVYREIRLARLAGILVVAPNGSGAGPGFMTPWGNSPHALDVGATGGGSTDPEVVGEREQRLASNVCDTCYAAFAGGSSSALVAGFAARLRAGAITPTADYVETLVKYVARDTVAPPNVEGYGVVDAAQLAGALAHAAAGTLPSRPWPDVNYRYVETVQGTLDRAWTDLP